eukprot:gene6352-8750_t
MNFNSKLLLIQLLAALLTRLSTGQTSVSTYTTDTFTLGDGRTVNLTPFDVNCKLKSGLIKSFRLTRPTDETLKYSYDCIQAPSTQYLISSSNEQTLWNNYGGGSISYLDRHTVSCSAGLVSNFQLQYVSSGPYIRYQYGCAKYGDLSCYTAVTVEKDASAETTSNVIYLDRFTDISCNAGYAIRSFAYSAYYVDEYSWIGDKWRGKFTLECCRISSLTQAPTSFPTTSAPVTSLPTLNPTSVPTTLKPTVPTNCPSQIPTAIPTTLTPTSSPTQIPTENPTTSTPSLQPTLPSNLLGSWESQHPIHHNLDSDTLSYSYDKAFGYSITFDFRSRLDESTEFVRFYTMDDSTKEKLIVGKYSGKDKYPGLNDIPALVINQRKFFVEFEISPSSKSWGVQFFIKDAQLHSSSDSKSSIVGKISIFGIVIIVVGQWLCCAVGVFFGIKCFKNKIEVNTKKKVVRTTPITYDEDDDVVVDDVVVDNDWDL